MSEKIVKMLTEKKEETERFGVGDKLKVSLFKYSISLLIKQEEVETLITIQKWFRRGRQHCGKKK